MADITVLGAGLVGSAIAIDLKKNGHTVTCIDSDLSRLEKLDELYSINTIVGNFLDKELIAKQVSKSDLVMGAVPGSIGYKVLEHLIGLKKNVVDISFFPENCFDLDKAAKDNGVCAVVDCGVAPGMSNYALGYWDKKIQIESFECYVGGLPFERSKPFEYKAPFSPADVLEEYTRPARLRRAGKDIELPALSELEHIEFYGIGTLEAFNTDGLRSLLLTFPHIPEMKEKTMRYPGHVDAIKVLKSIGLLNSSAIEVNGQKVSPLELTSKLLFEQWKLGEEEEELTAMIIKFIGVENGKKVSKEYRLFDIYDRITKISSMARTTAYTATATAELILNGDFQFTGICPPEFIGAQDNCFDKVISYLEDRGIVYEFEENEVFD